MIPSDTIGSWLVWFVTTVGVLVGGAPSASAAGGLAGDVVEAARTAVDAWSQFAATNDLTMVSEHFVIHGPQWKQFEAESHSWENSTGSEQVQLEVLEDRIRQLDSAKATVWLKVRASGPGFTSETFGWDFDLILDNGRWLVWTVVPAPGPTGPAEVVAPGSPTTLSTTTTTVIGAAPVNGRGADDGPVVAAGSSTGTRIPVLSAWIVVVTVIGVAVAGYMAPRIDRRSEG